MNAVIGLKTGVIRPNPELIKEEVEQLSGSLNWEIKHNPDATSRAPVFVRLGVHVHRAASAAPGTRVVTPEGLDMLKEAVLPFATEIAIDQGWTRPGKV